MNIEELESFCERWLAAWTGNDPDSLLEFYAEDAFYSDPAVRRGLHGHAEMRGYFKKLLAANPEWKWEVIELIPTDKGCVGKWHASIPRGEAMVEEDGVDIVEISAGKITRNEVYFDPSRLK